ncbi:hypothetical protein [uncultured Tenacibaculum sp.]|uniref:hypothetical protein n=1 Tax=uncultured Tenacibaculum sp. TaxID=174713 RepID=UPI0026259CCC|nr:hypothetical protein [uncultured Tenacibaculum sp.]
MKYYTIEWDYDNIEVIGHYPQVTLKKEYNPDLDDRIWKVRHHFFPNFIPNIELELHDKAKRTNFIERSDTYFGMFVDFKFKEVLKKAIIPPHKFYSIKVYHKGELLEYYWLHYIIDDFWKFLDIEKSKGKIIDQKNEFHKEELNLSHSIDSLLKKQEDLPYYQHMKWDKIVFKTDFPRYDIYETQTFDFKTVISESLLLALKEENISGFIAKPYNKIICK